MTLLTKENTKPNKCFIQIMYKSIKIEKYIFTKKSKILLLCYLIYRHIFLN